MVTDNTDANTSAQGAWSLSSGITGYQGANYSYHAPGTGLNSFTWTSAAQQSGEYQIYARWTAHANRASDAKYTVHHAGGATEVMVNQQQNGGVWNLLGVFSLVGDGSDRIELSDQANGVVF